MSTKQRYKVHPAADLFPLMTEEEFQGLKTDIKEHGQRDSITLWSGMLLDGRNRLRACEELGIDPQVGELDEATDPVAWVLAFNLHRRHLTTQQRSMVGARLATLKNGEHKDALPIGKATIDEAASLLNVGVQSICRAKQVIENGSSVLVAAVERDGWSLNFATQVIAAEPDKKQQAKLVAEGRKAVKEFLDEQKKPRETKAPPAETNGKSPLTAMRAYFKTRTTEDRVAVLDFIEACTAGNVTDLGTLHAMWRDWCDK